MIQVIGLLVAPYILSRCVEMQSNPRMSVRVHAALTYVWTLICIALLIVIPSPK
jgi:hypothetical protein